MSNVYFIFAFLVQLVICDILSIHLQTIIHTAIVKLYTQSVSIAMLHAFISIETIFDCRCTYIYKYRHTTMYLCTIPRALGICV